MNSSTGLRLFLIGTMLAGALYGASYQQYRFFNPREPGGLSDSGSYLAMASGKYDSASNYHKYRFVTPLLASWIAPLMPIQSTGNYEQEVLAYFIINFLFNWLAALFLFFILKQYGMSDLLSVVGGLLYIASRITVMTTGGPIVDAVVFAAVGALIWLINRDRPLVLAICLPTLVLAKETMLPLMILPLFTKQRRRPEVWVGIVIAILFFFVARQWWSDYVGLDNRSLAGDTKSFVQETLLMNVRRLFTLAGMHDLACGFTFLIPWAIFGYYLNNRKQIFAIPGYLLLLLPIGLGYAMLNGNLGRMFQIAFPLIIPYALVSIQAILVPSEKSVGSDLESPA